MQGKLFEAVKWGAGVWPAGTVVTIVGMAANVADKVKVQRIPGGPTAWLYLDDMEPIEE